jgi:nucleoside-diphosphate-sugar epimerase
MLPQLLLIGATGRTGRLILQQALNRGHFVTIIIRKASESLPRHENLTTVVGNPCNIAEVETAVLATRPNLAVVIVSALGQTRASGNPWAAPTSPKLFMESAIRSVLSACDVPKVNSTVNVVKLVSISAFGTGSSYPQLNFLMKLIMKYSNMSQTLEDQNAVDEVVKAGHLPFVLVRPAMLTEKEAAEVKVFGNDGEGLSWMPSISMASVAEFVLDATVRDWWDGMTPVISN